MTEYKGGFMKNIKKLAILVIALMIALSSLLLMASCGTNEESQDGTTDSSTGGNSTGDSSTGEGLKPDDKPDDVNPNLVKVTVVDQLGKPVSGASVQICQGETCFEQSIEIGSDGTGSREYDGIGEGALKAKVSSIDGMDDYLIPDEQDYVYFDEGSRELTIVVQKITVNVIDDSGEAIEGASVQLYQGEQAFKTTIYTDADGVACGFIALNGQKISCVVTEIINGSGYKLDGEAVAFEDGAYDATVVVKKTATYSVRLSSEFGEAITGAEVELYDAKTNIKQKTAHTDANGVVKFENIVRSDYYVKVTFISPAYVIAEESADGKYYFADGSDVKRLIVTELPEITYTVKVSNGLSGQTVNLYDTDNFLVASAQTDETGTAVLRAPNSSYTAILETEDGKYASSAFFVTDDSAIGEIEVTAMTAGESKDTPIILVGSKQLTLTAGQSVWLAVPNGYRKVLSVTSGVVVSYNDNQLNDNGVLIELEFEESKGEVSYFSVTSQSEKTIDVSVSAPGTKNEPIDITEDVISKGTHQIDAFGKGDLTVYYSLTADRDGAISVTVDTSYYYVLFNGVAGHPQDGDFLYPLSAGETVLISIIGSFYENESMDTGIFTFYFGEERVDYTVTVNKDEEAAQDIVVILCTKDGEEIARGTTNREGRYVFEDVVYGNSYAVKVEYPEGYTSEFEQVELGTATYCTVVLSPINAGE